MNTSARDVDWIRAALQQAMELEYSTQPLYLAALFSLEVQNYVAYNWIRAIVMEEMVHMAIAANMLAAIGGTPQIKNIKSAFPAKGLPGGVEPGLFVGLARYSPEQLQNFMRIECPKFLLADNSGDAPYPTVSSFYEEIREAISSNGSALNAAAAAVKRDAAPNQVGDNIGLPTVVPAADGDVVGPLCAAIDSIVEQGEGTAHGSLLAGPGSENEKSHFVRFGELYYGREYEHPDDAPPPTLQTLPERFSGMRIGTPQVINTLAVPSDGYAAVLGLDSNGALAKADLDAFDAQLSGILTQLEAVWNGPPADSWKTLGGAVEAMMKLRVLSCFKVERHQIPPDVVGKLGQLYPQEFDYMSRYTDLSQPVFYGPRFLNTNTA